MVVYILPSTMFTRALFFSLHWRLEFPSSVGVLGGDLRERSAREKTGSFFFPGIRCTEDIVNGKEGQKIKKS